ncbi:MULTISPECIES: hypothetical protein [Streptomyces]|uniref:hypothetical protein n=1 Tax=Streptomyces lycopersici TaxID=2974589 RepID=UPI0021D18E34|nr:hypothetical protein [Streptomyces sp. NEAU-383]
MASVSGCTAARAASSTSRAEGTVYVAGGKQGLLHLLIEEWARSPVRQDSIDRLAELDDPEEILRLPAASTKQVRQTHGDIMRILLATAPHDQVAADGLAKSTARYQATLALVAERLHDLVTSEPASPWAAQLTCCGSTSATPASSP